MPIWYQALLNVPPLLANQLIPPLIAAPHNLPLLASSWCAGSGESVDGSTDWLTPVAHSKVLCIRLPKPIRELTMWFSSRCSCLRSTFLHIDELGTNKVCSADLVSGQNLWPCLEVQFHTDTHSDHSYSQQPTKQATLPGYQDFHQGEAVNTFFFKVPKGAADISTYPLCNTFVLYVILYYPVYNELVYNFIVFFFVQVFCMFDISAFSMIYQLNKALWFP